jgi:uncharacterized protein
VKEHGENSGESASPPQRNRFFLGKHGLRAGWRILIFVLLLIAITSVMAFPLRHTLRALQPGDTITPTGTILAEGIQVFGLLVAAAIMTKIEGHSFSDYGFPLRQAFDKHFWQGVPLGFIMLTLLLILIASFRGFSHGEVVLNAKAAAKYGAMYAVAFLLTAIFEEFCFRGYLQAALASGIGFRQAAIILGGFYGAFHLNNHGETEIGAIMAGCFGMLCAFTLWRTGSLWLAIGMHTAWDWGETFFYSVPDSGLLAQGHLLNSSFHGPDWLTGGTVGPEASVFVFPVLLLWLVTIHLIFPEPAPRS